MGARVKAARHAAGLSQRQLGAKIRLTQSRMSQVETGTRRLSFSEAVEVALFLKVPVAKLVSDEVCALLHEIEAASSDDASGANAGDGDQNRQA